MRKDLNVDEWVTPDDVDVNSRKFIERYYRSWAFDEDPWHEIEWPKYKPKKKK